MIHRFVRIFIDVQARANEIAMKRVREGQVHIGLDEAIAEVRLEANLLAPTLSEQRRALMNAAAWALIAIFEADDRLEKAGVKPS
jgi:hypothetical protein